MKQGKPPENVTNKEVKKSELWKGYYFKIYFNGKDYANFISVSYPTKAEAYTKMALYLETGKFDWEATK